MKQFAFSKRMLLFVLIAVVVLSLAACRGTIAGTTNPAPASQTGGLPTNSITVSGTGDAFGRPDVAFVQLGVSSTNENVGDAVNANNATMQAITEALTGLGIAAEDIQTTNFNVWPEDRYNPETGQPTGERVYHVDSSVQVKVHNLDMTSQVIEAGLNAGANSVGGLSFGIEDTDALEAQARTSALDDARAKASQLAEAMGVQLGDAIIVSEVVGGYLPPVMYDAAAAERGVGGGAGAPPISPGQQSVSVTVYVTFAAVR